MSTIAFISGLFIGGTLGFLCAALMAAAKRGDENQEKINRG